MVRPRFLEIAVAVVQDDRGGRGGRGPLVGRAASNRVTGNRGGRVADFAAENSSLVLQGVADGLLQRGAAEVLGQDPAVGADQERRRDRPDEVARGDARRSGCPANACVQPSPFSLA